VVDRAGVVYPSASGYQLVPFVRSSKRVLFGVSTAAGSTAQAVGALALQILIPGMIDVATQLNTFRWQIRVHQSENPLWRDIRYGFFPDGVVTTGVGVGVSPPSLPPHPFRAPAAILERARTCPALSRGHVCASMRLRTGRGRSVETGGVGVVCRGSTCGRTGGGSRLFGVYPVVLVTDVLCYVPVVVLISHRTDSTQSCTCSTAACPTGKTAAALAHSRSAGVCSRKSSMLVFKTWEGFSERERARARDSVDRAGSRVPGSHREKEVYRRTFEN